MTRAERARARRHHRRRWAENVADDYERHRSHWPWPFCNPSCGVPYPKGRTL